MNWLIYGDILEHHVVESLNEEFKKLGETIYSLPSLKRGHIIDYDTEDVVLDRLLDFIKDKQIDALFNYRAAELTPKTIEKLKKLGIKTFVWFPDDPLLYDICYKHIAPYYDVTLHCGSQNVLDFYEEQLYVKGVLFPFWTNDSHFPYLYDLEQADIEVGFLGNCTGKQRSDRYDVLAKIPYETRIFGKLEKNQEDYANIHAGYINNFDDISNTIKRFKIGLNFSQKFTDIKKTKFYYKGVEQFREFFFPSRIIQYASTGIPIINFSEIEEEIMPSIISVRTNEELLNAVGIVNNPRKLLEISKQTKKDSERYLSARSRAELLLKLYHSDHKKYSVEERANLWKPKKGLFQTLKQKLLIKA